MGRGVEGQKGGRENELVVSLTFFKKTTLREF